MQKKRRNRCMLQTVQMLSLICVNFILSSDRHHKTGHFQIKENDLLSQKKNKKKSKSHNLAVFFAITTPTGGANKATSAIPSLS